MIFATTLKEDVIASLQTPINLVCDVFSQQSLKDEPFETFDAATETEIEISGINLACGWKHYSWRLYYRTYKMKRE